MGSHKIVEGWFCFLQYDSLKPKGSIHDSLVSSPNISVRLFVFSHNHLNTRQKNNDYLLYSRFLGMHGRQQEMSHTFNVVDLGVCVAHRFSPHGGPVSLLVDAPPRVAAVAPSSLLQRFHRLLLLLLPSSSTLPLVLASRCAEPQSSSPV